MISSIAVLAQDPEDALRLSWFRPNGTPRSNALGGAMGSLGGDLSAVGINPAGLGFYKNGEFYIGTQYSSKTNNINYFGNPRTSGVNKSSLGTLGMVFTDDRKKGNWKSTTFSIALTKVADYNNSISYRGNNNQSSFLEKFADQLYYDGASINQANQNYIYGSSLAYQSKLVLPKLNANGDVIDYYAAVPVSGGLTQFYDATTTGSYNELSFAWGGNMEDKLYLGASIVMPMINYSKSMSMAESVSSSNAALFDFNENYNSKGFGLGAKLGLIYKPASFLRLGFTVHTPQIISFNDATNATMYSNTFAGGISSADLANNYSTNYYPSNFNYNVITPLKTIFSGSYFFANPKKPTEPLGFISADVEWINYAGTKYSSLDDSKSVIDYYDDLNTVIKRNYTNAINFKVGSEVRLSQHWMVRAGTAYYGSPYNKNQNLKASHFVLSGGIGYRIGNRFIDITIMNVQTKDALFPYRLIDKNNYYADAKLNNLIFNIGYGIKFN